MPRSPTLIILVLVKKIFCVFRSRCRMCFSCKYYRSRKKQQLYYSAENSERTNGRTDGYWLTWRAMAIWTNHSTTCLSGSSSPFCCLSLWYRSPPSQKPITMYSWQSSPSHDSRYVTMLGCLSWERSCASCSAARRSRLEDVLRFSFLITYCQKMTLIVIMTIKIIIIFFVQYQV